MTVTATVLLDQLRASFCVHIGEVQYLDAESGQLLWMLTARSEAGEAVDRQARGLLPRRVRAGGVDGV